MTTSSSPKSKSTQKTKSRTLSRFMMTSALVAVGSFGYIVPAVAADYTLPTGGTILAGDGAASISASGIDKLNINQETDRVIINWNTFNIGADATVQFYQPNSGSLAVNKVGDSATFTRIDGKLKANGKVVILDPNGIIFGAGSVTDVGAIVASTGDINHAAVMAGGAMQLTNFGTGQIINNGVIKAIGGASDYGLVAFVAPTVKNNGVINAYLGRVSLAAGNETATVDLYGDGLVELAYSDKDANLLAENSGKIEALGGQIQMTAAAVKDTVDSVVNMKGIARASSATLVNGKIVLSAKKVKVGAFATVKGNTKVTAKSVDLGTTIDGVVTGASKEVNVLSDKAKISQGLSIVEANGTVNVAAGTYNDHLVVDKVGVTLNGANAGVSGTGVRGAETIVVPNSPGVTVTGDNVTIDGLTFMGATGVDGYGIFVNGADDVTLKNNIIKGTSQSGIYVLNSGSTKITDNKIGEVSKSGRIQGDGIRLVRGHNAVITGNTITGIYPSETGFGSGIYSVLSNNLQIGGATVGLGNNISNTNWDGIKLVSSNGANVENNTVDQVARAGLSVASSDLVTFKNNTVTNAGLWGVWGQNSTNLSILKNIVSDVKDGEGVFIDGGSNVVVDGNKINKTGSHGVYVLSSEDAIVRYNLIGTTGGAGNIEGDGVRGVFANDLRVHGNIISNMAPAGYGFGSGVYINYSNNAAVTFNRISNAKWDGVKVGFGDNYTVRGNEISNVTRAGVAVNDTTNSLVTGNTLTNLGRWGMWTVGNNGLDITNNKITNVTLFDGITSDEDSDLTISGNTITSSNRDGVHATGSNGVLTISGNTISNSGANGVYVGNFYGSSIILSRVQAVIEGNDTPSLSGLYINGNDISNSDENGIYVENATGYVEIKSNQIRNSDHNGIYVANYSPSYIKFASYDTSEEASDVVVQRLDGLYISLNQISNSGTVSDMEYSTRSLYGNGNGIEVVNANGYVEISNNDIWESAANGIYVHGYNRVSPSFMEESYPIKIRESNLELLVSGNGINDSGSNGVYLSGISGDLTVSNNEINNSGSNGILSENVNQYYGGMYYPVKMAVTQEGESDYDYPVYPVYPDYQLIISGNQIDNSLNNGVALYSTGDYVSVDNNTITNSGQNGIYAYNPSSFYYVGDEMVGEMNARTIFSDYDDEYSNPIELHIVNNTIENVGYQVETTEGDSEVARFINDVPFGFAAINLNISGDGYAEISGNTMGNNFEYGLYANSGEIDLTGVANTIENTNIGMGFYPVSKGTPDVDSDEYFAFLASQLKLTNDTIGTTKFVDQSDLFVDLGYGAFFAPGSPTLLNGNDATYTLGGATIAPSLNGGVTQAEYDVLEARINHFIDAQNRGLFFFNILPDTQGIDQKDVLRNVFGFTVPDEVGGSLTITGLPSIGGGAPEAPFNPNAIEPAAGDEETPTDGEVAGIQPAAGGDSTSCWTDASQSLGQGTPVTFNYGTDASSLLQDAASCGNGQGQNL